MKIFIGLIEVAGYYKNLSNGFREIGEKCIYVDLSNNPFKYQEEKNPFIQLLFIIRQKHLNNIKNSKISSIFWGFIERLYNFCLKLILLSWVFIVCDVFIFGFGSTFFRYMELPLLKFFKKKIIYVFNGSDSRPPFIGSAQIYELIKNKNKFDIEQCIDWTFYIKKRLKKIEKYADAIVCNIFSSHFHEKNIISYLHLGLPFFKNDTVILKKKISYNKVRILHSPSHREIKGTLIIRSAIEILKSKGYKIDYIEIIGQPNSIVIQELQKCDFIIDQIYSDTPMAGFATEAAIYGKPAIVGGYCWDELNRIISDEAIPPSHICHPDEIVEAIEQLIIDEKYRIQLGLKAKEFVENFWSPKQVAEKYMMVIKNNIPPDWIFDPSKLTYIYGGGIRKERMKQIVKEMIKYAGVKSLCLSDKPHLEKLFFSYAYTNEDKK